MTKRVMLWVGAGDIGMAIARRTGTGMKIIIGDKILEKAKRTAGLMQGAGFDAVPMEMDPHGRWKILEPHPSSAARNHCCIIRPLWSCTQILVIAWNSVSRTCPPVTVILGLVMTRGVNF